MTRERTRAARHRARASSVVLASLVSALPSLASAEYRQLYSESATASSYLQNNWNRFSENYHPSYLLDGDPKTAWVEGAPGDGHGEHVSWRISTLASASEVKLRVKNGYQKSKKLLMANAAPKEVEVALLGPRGVVVTKRFTLAREMGWQELVIPVPPNVALDGVKLTVLETWPGRVYKDTCVSDVETWVKTDVLHNRKAEEAKRARLLRWARSRRDEAAYFKKLPAEYPFASTHFTASKVLAIEERRALDGDSDDPTPTPGWRPAHTRVLEDDLPPEAAPHLGGQVLLDFKLIHELAQKEGRSLGEAWHKVELSRRLNLPDGLAFDWPYATFVPSFQDLLDVTAVSLAETPRRAAGKSRAYPPPEPDSAYGPEEWLKQWDATHARVKRGAGGGLIALYYQERRVVAERGVYDTDAHHVVLFDAKGRPERVVTLLSGRDGKSFHRLALVRDRAGQIARVEYREARFSTFEEVGPLGDSNRWNAVDYAAAALVRN